MHEQAVLNEVIHTRAGDKRILYTNAGRAGHFQSEQTPAGESSHTLNGRLVRLSVDELGKIDARTRRRLIVWRATRQRCRSHPCRGYSCPLQSEIRVADLVGCDRNPLASWAA